MSTTIARIYENYGNALEASHELKSRGFHRDEIDLISKAGNSEDSEITDLAGEISQAGVPADNVAAYAKAIDEGKSLLVVRAAWGAAVKALKVVDNHGPSAEASLNGEYYVTSGRQAAEAEAAFPFSLSGFLGIPLLLNDATPFSNFWHWPVLAPASATFSSLFASLSKGYTFGTPTLLSNGAIFSDELGLPVLLKTESGKVVQ